APRPPYSLGHEIPAQPPSNNLRCHVRKYSKRVSSGSSRFALQSPGTLALSQSRNSSRNCCSSAVRFKSIQLSLLPPAQPSARIATGPAWYFLRNSFFRTFPIAFLGKLSQNSIDCGHL